MYYIEKIKRHISNWVAYIKEHLIRIIFISFLLFVVCSLFTLLPRETGGGEQQILIFGITLSNWSIWLGIIAILGGAIWGLYEYDKSRISTQQEKAADIAKTFSDDLLQKCNTVISVYQSCDLYTLLKNIDTINSPFEHFTTEELREITEDDDAPSMYRKEKNKINFDYIYFRVLEQRITVFSEYEKKYESQDNNNSYSTEEARKLFILDNQSFPFHFSSLVDEVLNTLEYVCMNISSHAAGANFIYQSIHQIFFDTINILAFEISIRNDGKYSDKFYTNIIYVYNEWQKIYKKSRKNETDQKKQSKKILNPKISTVE